MTCFIAGDALGFDALVAQAVLNLKRDYAKIKLIFAVSCKNQADKWNRKAKMIYENKKIELVKSFTYRKSMKKAVCLREIYTRLII